MDSLVKFAALALISLVISIPLWMLLLANEFSMSMFADPELLFYMGFAMVVLIYVFSKGRQRKTDE
jgi:hypothetical protein